MPELRERRPPVTESVGVARVDRDGIRRDDETVSLGRKRATDRLDGRPILGAPARGYDRSRPRKEKWRPLRQVIAAGPAHRGRFQSHSGFPAADHPGERRAGDGQVVGVSHTDTSPGGCENPHLERSGGHGVAHDLGEQRLLFRRPASWRGRGADRCARPRGALG